VEYSKTGLQFTEQFESCRTSAYSDIGGVPTIGWGTTIYPNGSPVKLGDTCTIVEADNWLMWKVQQIVDKLNRLLLNPNSLTQSQFDALVDFTYNVGLFNFQHSTLLRLINAGNLQAAANEFEKWDHVNGKEVAGLLRRRLEEKQEFQS